jgi:hypothetical protein
MPVAEDLGVLPTRRARRTRALRGAVVVASFAAMALAAMALGTPSARGAGDVYALLGTGAVVRAEAAGGRAVAIADVSRAPLRDLGSGPFLAMARRTLMAAVPGRPSRLVAVRLPRGPARTVRSFPAGFALRALVRGPVSGQLYVIGNQAIGAGVRALRVFTLSPDGAQVVRDETVKPSAALVFSASLSADEDQLAVAYHGAADGFDLLDPTTLSLLCESPTIGGCIRGHGSVHHAGTRLFSATGTSAFAELLSSATVLRRTSGLPGNHLLELASTDSRFLYLTGNCGYTGGLSRLDLHTKRLTILTTDHDLCGSRLLATPTDLLLAANPLPVPRPHAAARILVANRHNGRLRHTIRTPGSIVDLATSG